MAENLTPQQKAALTKRRNKIRDELASEFEDWDMLSDEDRESLIDERMAEAPADETGDASEAGDDPSIADVAEGAENPLAIRVPRIADERLLDKKPYWIGTCAMKPVQNVTLGGQRFPHFSGNPNFSESGKADRPMELGDEVMLSEPEVEHILQDIKRKVLRPLGDRSVHFNRGSKRNPTRPTDQPMAKFVYMVPGRRGREIPPSLFAGFEDDEE